MHGERADTIRSVEHEEHGQGQPAEEEDDPHSYDPFEDGHTGAVDHLDASVDDSAMFMFAVNVVLRQLSLDREAYSVGDCRVREHGR